MTAEREQLLQKIKRVQALAERGEGGEKENAAALLERMMKQYGISESDIAEERREIAWFRYKTPLEEKLLAQVIYSVVGDLPLWERKNSNTKRRYKLTGVECTAAERLEIEFSYDFFKAAMEKELDRFFSAFINKNGIFPPPEKERKTENPRGLSLDELARLESMMAGMDRHTCRVALESGENRDGG